jgi:O-antigen ligase
VVTVAYYSVPTTTAVDRSRRLLVTAALPLTLIAMGVALPYTAAGSKLLSGLGLTAATNSVDRTGIGTQSARQQAWSLVLDHVGAVGARITGVGFGPDFLRESGATVPLGNGESLRSPHNFLIGSYARLGLVGLVLVAVVLLLAVRALLVAVRAPDLDELVLLAGLVMAALLVSSLFGVELEAPFGAVPFFWSMGIVLATARDHRRKEPAP